MSVGRASEITRSELDSVRGRYRNVYELIHAVRPGMLNSRDFRPQVSSPSAARGEPRGVKVFVDDIHVGGIDVLTTIPVRSIAFIVWMSPSDATTRYGSGMTGGVISITTVVTRPR